VDFPTSLPGFQRVFPDEPSCAAYLEDVRWPDGFECPYCHERGDPYRIATRPSVLECRSCRRQVSLTSGTVMERTHTPLCVWFWAAYLVTSQTPGMSAVQFQRQLGLSRYETAFQILHKLCAGMVRPDRDRIGGEWPVEVDEVWIGGKTRGEGHGVHHKSLVVGAVEVRKSTGKKKPHGGAAVPKREGKYAGRLRMRVVPTRQQKDLEKFVVENVEPHSHVITDGWVGYNGLEAKGYDHEPVVLLGDPERTDAVLPMIHLVFSNIKTWLLGTHHGVSPKHLQAYVNEYVFRFNRRFWPFNAFHSVLGIAVHAESATYDELYSGEWVHPNPVHAP
jgi:transposase-like protein